MQSTTTGIIARLEELSAEYNLLSSHLDSAQRNIYPIGQVDDIKDAQIIKLQEENNHLNHKVQELLKAKQVKENVAREKEEELLDRIRILLKESEDNANDTEMLKDVVKRLNEQLNRYHLKYGAIAEEHRPETKGTLRRDNIYKLNGLLRAYDEIIIEREQAVKSSSRKLEEVMSKVDAVTQENKKLHARIDALQTENSQLDHDEVGQITANAKLLLEERQLLLKEINVLKQQQAHLLQGHKGQVMELEQSLKEYESKCQSLESSLELQESRRKVVEQQCQALEDKIRSSVSKEEHQLAVKECKRLFEELKTAYGRESGELKGKVRSARMEKQHLTDQLTESTTQVHNLSSQVSGLKHNLRKVEGRNRKGEIALQSIYAAKRLAQTRMRSLAQVCSELLDDRGQLLQTLAVQSKELEEYKRELTFKSTALGTINHKLKEEKINWRTKLAEAEGGRKAAKEAWKKSVREAEYLRKILASKEDTLNSLLDDYRILGLDFRKLRQGKLIQQQQRRKSLYD